MMLNDTTYFAPLRIVTPSQKRHIETKIKTDVTVWMSMSIAVPKKLPCPKNNGISKLVVWRSQNPAIQSQTPL